MGISKEKEIVRSVTVDRSRQLSGAVAATRSRLYLTESRVFVPPVQRSGEKVDVILFQPDLDQYRGVWAEYKKRNLLPADILEIAAVNEDSTVSITYPNRTFWRCPMGELWHASFFAGWEDQRFVRISCYGCTITCKQWLAGVSEC